MFPGGRLALYSLQNYPHIVMFSFFFVLSYIQFRGSSSASRFVFATLATLAMGLLVELARESVAEGIAACAI